MNPRTSNTVLHLSHSTLLVFTKHFCEDFFLLIVSMWVWLEIVIYFVIGKEFRYSQFLLLLKRWVAWSPGKLCDIPVSGLCLLFGQDPNVSKLLFRSSFSYNLFHLFCTYLYFYCVLNIVVPTFAPFAHLCPAHPCPTFNSLCHCPSPWVLFTCSLAWPFPLFPPSFPSPLPSGHYQIVLYFHVSCSVLHRFIFIYPTKL